MHVLPSDVSDVLVTSGVAHLPIQSDGTWSSGGWRLTMNRSLIILSRLHDTDRETLMEQKNNNEKTLLFIIHTKRLHCMWTMNNPYRLDIGNRYSTVNNQLFSGNTVCSVISQRQKGEWNSVSQKRTNFEVMNTAKQTKKKPKLLRVFLMWREKWRMIDRSWLLIMVLTSHWCNI